MAKKVSSKAKSKTGKAPAKPASKVLGKPAGKSSAKSAGKSAGKSSARPAATSKSKPAKLTASASVAPPPVEPISTGSGPSPADIGREFVALFNARTPDAVIWDKLFAKDFTSVEGHGANVAFHGRKSVEKKNAEWSAANTVHGCAGEGPYAGSTGFAVKFRVDKTENATGKRELMEEMAFYTVRDGKIIREEFFYSMF